VDRWIIAALWLALVCRNSIAVAREFELYECNNITRMRLLFLGPKHPVNSFRKLTKTTNEPDCPEWKSSGTLFNTLIGNLKTIDLQDIVSALRHDPECKDWGPEFDITPDCIAGVTSEFKEELIRRDLSSLRQQRVASIGEGDVGQVDQLLKSGVQAYGVDIGYGRKISVAKDTVMGKHPKHYVWGDATRFSTHPLTKKPFDLVFSFCLLCQLGPKLGAQSIVEGIKALKPGGQLRFTYGIHDAMSSFDGDLVEIQRNMIRDAAKQLQLAGIRFEVFSAQERYLEENGLPEKRPRYQFIMFTRLKDGQSSAPVQTACP
jgi:hypothetical protein